MEDMDNKEDMQPIEMFFELGGISTKLVIKQLNCTDTPNEDGTYNIDVEYELYQNDQPVLITEPINEEVHQYLNDVFEHVFDYFLGAANKNE